MVSRINRQIFTNVGFSSWTAPAGVTNITVSGCGGGGGGAAGENGYLNANYKAAGGHAGGGSLYSMIEITVLPGNSYSVLVGSRGHGGVGSNGAGGNGEDSFFCDASTIKPIVYFRGATGGGIFSFGPGSQNLGQTNLAYIGNLSVTFYWKNTYSIGLPFYFGDGIIPGSGGFGGIGGAKPGRLDSNSQELNATYGCGGLTFHYPGSPGADDGTAKGGLAGGGGGGGGYVTDQFNVQAGAGGDGGAANFLSDATNGSPGTAPQPSSGYFPYGLGGGGGGGGGGSNSGAPGIGGAGGDGYQGIVIISWVE